MKNSPTPVTVEPKAVSNNPGQRYIFDGTYKKSAQSGAQRSNRHMRPRKRSLFSIMAILLAASMLITFYVWNKICVNRLAVEIKEIDKKINMISYNNTNLESEISKKSSWERIESLINTGQLNLIIPREQPEMFSIDEERLKQLQKKE